MPSLARFPDYPFPFLCASIGWRKQKWYNSGVGVLVKFIPQTISHTQPLFTIPDYSVPLTPSVPQTPPLPHPQPLTPPFHSTSLTYTNTLPPPATSPLPPLTSPSHFPLSLPPLTSRPPVTPTPSPLPPLTSPCSFPLSLLPHLTSPSLRCQRVAQ